MGAACSTPPPLPVGSCRLTIHSVVLHNRHRSGEGVTFLRQNLREGVTFLRLNLRPIGEGVTFLSNRHVSSPKPSAEHILGVGWATLRWCVRATQRRPPIARTAHVVHCACATCARVTRVGWSAVSQSRAVVESATGSWACGSTDRPTFDRRPEGPVGSSQAGSTRSWVAPGRSNRSNRSNPGRSTFLGVPEKPERPKPCALCIDSI